MPPWQAVWALVESSITRSLARYEGLVLWKGESGDGADYKRARD